MKSLQSHFSFMRGNVIVIVVADALARASTSLGWPYFSLYIMALGGSPTTVGFVYAIGVLAGLPTFPIGGYISDYSGRVKLVAIATLFEALTAIFFIFAKDWRMMVIGLFLWQATCFHYPLLSAIMADSLPPGRRGIGFAIDLALPGILGFITPYVSGYLIDAYGGGYSGVLAAMPICWTACLMIKSLSAIIRLRFLQETIESTSNFSLRNIPLLLENSYKSVFESIKWMSKPLLAITMISVIMTFFTSIATPFWIIYATTKIGLSASSWGILILILGIVQICLSIPMGHLADRFGARRLIIIALTLSIIPVFSFTFCRNFPEVLLTLFILTVTNAILWPAFSAVKADLIPRERRGRLMSILGQGGQIISWSGGWALGIILFIPLSVGMLIGGYIYESNPRYPWFILAASIIICLVLAIKFLHETKKPEI